MNHEIKPFGKALIAIVIIGLLYLGYSTFIKGKSDSKLTNNTTASTSGSDTTAPASHSDVSESGTTEHRTFEYTPEAPQSPVKKGVIEVGASGFNSFVVSLDKSGRWEMIKKEFGSSLAYEGMTTTEDIRSQLANYISAMLNQGVNGKNIQFVVSSGALKAPKTSLITAELAKKGYVVNKVTAEQEGIYAFKATVPPSFRDNSLMVDIGSGNTKVSYEQNGKMHSVELPGAKYFQKGLSDEQVTAQVKAAVAALPNPHPNVVFIIGGVPASLAKQTRQAEERFTVLSAPTAYAAKDEKEKSGLTIYKALQEATNADTFVFDWDSNFTIGFLLGLK